MAGTLRRFAGYAIQPVQPTDPALAPLNAAASVAQVAGNITGCTVTSSTAQVQAEGIVTLRLTLSNPGGSVALVHQVQLDNSQ
jgi:MSHA biogenesis protein MshO